jgi:hypothetical protein
MNLSLWNLTTLQNFDDRTVMFGVMFKVVKEVVETIMGAVTL